MAALGYPVCQNDLKTSGQTDDEGIAPEETTLLIHHDHAQPHEARRASPWFAIPYLLCFLACLACTAAPFVPLSDVKWQMACLFLFEGLQGIFWYSIQLVLIELAYLVIEGDGDVENRSIRKSESLNTVLRCLFVKISPAIFTTTSTLRKLVNIPSFWAWVISLCFHLLFGYLNWHVFYPLTKEVAKRKALRDDELESKSPGVSNFDAAILKAFHNLPQDRLHLFTVDDLAIAAHQQAMADDSGVPERRDSVAAESQMNYIGCLKVMVVRRLCWKGATLILGLAIILTPSGASDALRLKSAHLICSLDETCDKLWQSFSRAWPIATAIYRNDNPISLQLEACELTWKAAKTPMPSSTGEGSSRSDPAS